MAKTDRPDMPKAKITKESLREMMMLFAYLKPYRMKFILAFIFIALSAFSTMIFPFLLGELIDTAGTQGITTPMGDSTRELFTSLGINPEDIRWGLNTIIGLIFLQLTVQMLFSYMRIYLLTEVGEKALGNMRKDIYTRLLLMPMSFFSERRVGELQSRVSADISQIQDTLTFTLAEFLRGIFTLVFGLVLIFWISSQLALVMLAVVPLVAILAVVFGMRIRKMSRKAQDELADSGTIMQETLQGIQVVKSFTNEKYEVERYGTSILSVVGTTIANGRFRGAFVSLLIFSVFGTVAFVMWYGAGMIQDNELTVGDLTKFVVFSAFIGGTMAGFADMFSQLQKALGATQRVREILRDEVEPIRLDYIPEPKRLNGEVQFRNVAFSYPHREEIQVLSEVSLSVKPGEKIAVVGPSGAGKSTLAALLLRFYETTKGQILFDNKQAKEYDLSYLRSQIAIVPQDVQLFGGSIYENILYGRPGANRDEVFSAARKANAHDFISGFPETYDTLVGERGIKLSGGQRQRIAIARAILKDPAILILDEATSSLDSESERLVQDALEELMQGRTSFIIAHRLSTIRSADKIVVLEKGRVVEEGSHEELMRNKDGLYYRLSTLQLEFASGEELSKV